MARSGKSRSTKDEAPKVPSEVEDAVIVPEEAEKPESAPDGTEGAGAAETSEPAEDMPDGPQEMPSEEPDPVEETDTPANETDPDTGGEERASSDPEPAEPGPDIEDAAAERDPFREPEPAVTKEVIVQKVGFIPLVLGGAIAAGLGFVLAFYYFGQPGSDYDTMIAAQADRIAELEAQVASLPTDQPDIGPIAARIDEVEAAQTSLGARLEASSTDLTDRIAAIDDRLTEIERTPGEDGTLAQTAIESWERELEALRAEFAAQQAEMAALTEQAQADLEAARAEAEAVEQSAEDAARAAVARAALSRVQAALDSGSPFGAALADLEEAGIEVPSALAGLASDGAPTIIALRDEFPAAARAALSAARAEGLADEGANPLTAFLRDQLEVRSVQPREGDDPDAILSRAEASLADNRLTDTLAEIDTLPEVARSEMSDWIARATARADALAAADTIDQSLSN